MIILIGILLLIVPYCIGNFAAWILDRKSDSRVQMYLMGCLLVIIFSGVSQLAAIFLQLSFSKYTLILNILLGVFTVAGAVTYALRFARADWIQLLKLPRQVKGRDVASVAVLTVLLLLTITAAAVRIPDNTGDFTMETVRTTLATDTIYEYNSFTGLQISEGMPIRQQILTFPFFMAGLCRSFSVDAEGLVYGLIPCWMVFMGFLVSILWAQRFFPEDKHNRELFIGAFLVLILLGDYGKYSLTHLLFAQGFTGYAWLAAVLIPFTIYLCMGRKWIVTLLAIAAEIFLIWTTYGLGYTIMITAVFAVIIKIADIRGKKLCM